MKVSSVDPKRCPLCGNDNHCGALAGSGTCWCFNESISPAVLERVPAEAQGVACVCRFCASSQGALTRALEQMAELLRRR